MTETEMIIKLTMWQLIIPPMVIASFCWLSIWLMMITDWLYFLCCISSPTADDDGDRSYLDYIPHADEEIWDDGYFPHYMQRLTMNYGKEDNFLMMMTMTMMMMTRLMSDVCDWWHSWLLMMMIRLALQGANYNSITCHKLSSKSNLYNGDDDYNNDGHRNDDNKNDDNDDNDDDDDDDDDDYHRRESQRRDSLQKVHPPEHAECYLPICHQSHHRCHHRLVISQVNF